MFINDITDFVIRDEDTFEYLVTEDWEKSSVLTQVSYKINNGKINVPFVSSVLQFLYPFIQKGIKQDVIDKAIDQGNCVHEMIHNSIQARNTTKLVIQKNDCKNSNHIQLAVRTITELNSFIYKHKITKIFSERTLINLDGEPYIGTPDLIMTNSKEWFLMDLKTSRSNYVDKAKTQLQMYKELIQNNTDIKINKMFVLNPREDIVIFEVEDISKEIKYKVLNTIKQLGQGLD